MNAAVVAVTGIDKTTKMKSPKLAGATTEGAAVDEAFIVVIEAARAVLG